MLGNLFPLWYVYKLVTPNMSKHQSIDLQLEVIILNEMDEMARCVSRKICSGKIEDSDNQIGERNDPEDF